MYIYITCFTCYIKVLLGRNVAVTSEDSVSRCTVGIEITSMQLSGRDLFSVWDFAGQIESFITHQLFISTQSTVFTVLINLTDSLEMQKDQLMRWLGFIKMRNLGQVRQYCYCTTLIHNYCTYICTTLESFQNIYENHSCVLKFCLVTYVGTC